MYLLANFGFDTDENESLKVYLNFKLVFSLFNFHIGTRPWMKPTIRSCGYAARWTK